MALNLNKSQCIWHSGMSPQWCVVAIWSDFSLPVRGPRSGCQNEGLCQSVLSWCTAVFSRWDRTESISPVKLFSVSGMKPSLSSVWWVFMSFYRSKVFLRWGHFLHNFILLCQPWCLVFPWGDGCIHCDQHTTDAGCHSVCVFLLIDVVFIGNCFVDIQLTAVRKGQRSS